MSCGQSLSAALAPPIPRCALCSNSSMQPWPMHDGLPRLSATDHSLPAPGPDGRRRQAALDCSTPTRCRSARHCPSILRNRARRGREIVVATASPAYARPRASALNAAPCLAPHKLAIGGARSADTPICPLLRQRRPPCRHRHLRAAHPRPRLLSTARRHRPLRAGREVPRNQKPQADFCISRRRFDRPLHIPNGFWGRSTKRSAGRWGVPTDTSGASPRTP